MALAYRAFHRTDGSGGQLVKLLPHFLRMLHGGGGRILRLLRQLAGALNELANCAMRLVGSNPAAFSSAQ